MMKATKEAGLKRTIELLLTLLKASAYDDITLSHKYSKIFIPDAFVKSLKPLGVKQLTDYGEFELLRNGYWRAGGRWVKSCECTGELGYPCYSSPRGVKDAKSCFSFLDDFHHMALPIAPKKGADVKYPWFYLRFHHLAKASLIALDGKDLGRAKDVLNHVDPYFGPAWGNAMEAGIRALNAIFAMEYALKYDLELARELTRLIALTPPFILRFMEGWTTTSNHTMMDLVGLISSISFLSTAHNGFAKFLDKTLPMFVTEVNLQLSEGWQYEAATAYHLLVTEGILATLFVLNRTQPRYYEKVYARIAKTVKKAVENLASMTLPDSSFPLVGDNGSDRALVLERLTRNYTSTLTSLSLALSLNVLKELPKLSEDAKEELVSILNALGGQYAEEAKVLKSNDPWMHVYNDSEKFVALYCAETRRGVPSGHHHSDKGGFVLWYGKWIVLDPGTFSYTGLPEVRDLMRSALLHSAPRPCGKEQCSYPSSFSAECFCKCTFNDYMNLKVRCGGKTFSRKVRILEDKVIVEDSFEGGCWEESLVSPKVDGENLNGIKMNVEGPVVERKILDAFWSPSYGVIEEAKVLMIRYEKANDFKVIKEFILR